MTDDLITEEPQIEHIPVWQSDLFLCNNPYHDMLKQPLLDAVYAHRDASKRQVASDIATAAKQRLFESELDFLDRDNADIQLLNHTLTDLVLTIASDLNGEYWPEDAEGAATITESWYHVTRSGGYHDAHSHPNCSWCGIYYLDVGDSDFERRSGVNRFYDPRLNADHYLDAGAMYLNASGVWDMAPVDGQVVIFPSYLKHSALPYFGESERVVIAFNARVDLV